jgi:hypothetical protein
MNTAAEMQRAYGYVDDEGLGRCYRCRLHPDPDVEKELRWIWSSNVSQAIGRLRSARSEEPKFVILDSAMPVDHVRVHLLGSMKKGSPQPEALKAKSAASKLDRETRIAQLVAKLAPLYRRESDKTVIGRLRFIKLVKEQMGEDLTRWEAQQVLATLDRV